MSHECISEYNYPCSLDVVSLYTSIPPQEATINILNLVRQHKIQIAPLLMEDIEELLHIIHTNIYFGFRDRTYRQISGLAMGSSISAILAISFMHKIETSALSNLGRNFVGVYKRYVDDCFASVRNEDEAQQMVDVFNRQHPHIRFEMEKPTDQNELSLLDFTIKFSPQGDTTYSFYRKKARKEIFLHADSAIADYQRMAILRNERNRIAERCSNIQQVHQEQAKFDEILMKNGYKPGTIARSKRKAAKKRHRANIPANNNILYMRAPYINDALDQQIKHIYAQEGLNLRIVHRANTLRQQLKPHSQLAHCTLKGCTMQNKNCMRKKVVYLMKCTICRASYVGCTIRHLHTRVKEHTSNTESAVHQHSQTHTGGTTWCTTILCTERDIVDLRISEGLFISRLKPELNNQEEMQAMAPFIFR